MRGRDAFDDFVATTRQLLGPGPLAAVSWPSARRSGGAVILAEASVPVALLVPGLSRVGFGVAMLPLTAFRVAIAGVIRRKVRTSCRCFGASATPVGRWHLVRDMTLFVVAVTAFAFGSTDPAGAADLVVAAASGSVLAAAVIRLDDVIDLFLPGLLGRRT